MKKFIEHLQKHKHFYGTVGSLNLGALCMGLAMGWPTPSFAYLYDDRVTDPMVSIFDQSWVESVINAGASLGSLASIFSTSFYGRRCSFYLSASIIVGFWIFLASSGIDRTLIVIAAGVAGFGVGMFFATAVLYVPEISPIENRGVIGAIVFLSCYFGVFIFNLAGNVFEITFVLSIQIIFPLLFLVTIRFLMIESPMYLFQQGTVLKAKISLKYLRGCNSVLDINSEYKAMEGFFNANCSKDPGQLLLESLCPKSMRPLTLISIPLLCIGQMLSAYAIDDYAETIFETLYPSTGKLMTSLINVFSIICCLFIIERCGRRPLLIFATASSSFCCLLLAIFSVVDEKDCDFRTLESKHKIYPLTILCCYYAVYALGLIPVLPIVTGEIFPCRTKTVAIAVCISLLYFVAFFMQRSYDSLNRGISSCQAFALFTMFGSIGLPFAAYLLPETRGKSLLQIQNDLVNIVTV